MAQQFSEGGHTTLRVLIGVIGFATIINGLIGYAKTTAEKADASCAVELKAKELELTKAQEQHASAATRHSNDKMRLEAQCNEDKNRLVAQHRDDLAAQSSLCAARVETETSFQERSAQLWASRAQACVDFVKVWAETNSPTRTSTATTTTKVKGR